MPLAKDAKAKPLFALAFTSNGAEFARQAEASSKEQSDFAARDPFQPLACANTWLECPFTVLRYIFCGGRHASIAVGAAVVALHHGSP